MKNFIPLLLIGLLFSAKAFAECIQLAPQNINIEWTAFKTPMKVGVSGKLTQFKLHGLMKGPSLQKIAPHLSIEISTEKVYTKNPSRDKKIVQFFFKPMKKRKITAKIVKLTPKKIILSIEMNGVLKKVPMTYSFQHNKFEAKGVIDILDFNASESLQKINRACFARHEGKTWSDVDIKLTAKFTPCS